ncbi:MAG TPA: hypothetical protein DEA49_00195 [Petrotoga sp.]|nr:MAG: Uncharacterized protein XD53_0310 [Petrotoga mobilis]HBT50527.1 hypothetical protein [Petrotoga sp.]
MNSLYIFHYHYIKGGVSTVVRNIVKSLKDEYKITLFGSKKMGIDGIEEVLSYKNVNFVDFPELGYIYYDSTDYQTFLELKESIKNKLNNYHDERAIYWAHNYNLGKNPAFTAAFKEFIIAKNICTIIQIHDFPECARWENYSFIRKFINSSLYPIGKNIFYATINLADYNRLIKSGIPSKNTFYLPNAVEFTKNKDKKDEIDKDEVIYKLKKLGYNVDPKNKNILYPTRTIRRKNILEAVLINRLYGKSNLLVTLPANSEKERPYERVVKETFESEKVKGAWAISAKDPSLFPYILNIADLFFSSSVLEGFGMIYLESKFNEKNFLTRKLDVIEDFKNIKEISYYDRFLVRLSPKEIYKVKEEYEEQINKIPISENYKNYLREDLTNKFDKDSIDFSFLPVQLQKKFCTIEETKLKDLKEINKEIFDKIEVLTSTQHIDQGINLEDFSLKAYKSRISLLLDKVQTQKGNAKKIEDTTIDENILKSFLIIDNMRLLFSY